MSNTEILHIDQLANVCGYFNTDTRANNGYGCEHPDCGDSDLMILKNGVYEFAYGSFGTDDRAIAKKMLGRKISNRRKNKKAIKKARLITHNNVELAKLGLKQQGKCYSFSCPLCYEADEEYCNENGIEFEYDMIVIDVELLTELES